MTLSNLKESGVLNHLDDLDMLLSDSASSSASGKSKQDPASAASSSPATSSAASAKRARGKAKTKSNLTKEEKQALRRRRRALAERQRVHSRQQALVQMREEVRQLQYLYQSLRRRAELRQQRIAGTIQSDKNASLSQQSLLDAAHQIEQLRIENCFFQQLLDQKLTMLTTLERITSEFSIAPPLLSASSAKSLSTLRRQPGHLNGFSFVPFSVDDCQRIVSSHLQKQMSTLASQPPTASESEVESGILGNAEEHLGWTGRRVLDRHGTSLLFDHVKVWQSEVHDVISRLWAFMMRPRAFERVYARPRHLEILQIVSDNMVVFRRIVENVTNGALIHSVFLGFRIRRGASFLVGMVSLPLWGNVDLHDLNDTNGRWQLTQQETTIKFHKFLLFSPLHGGSQTHVRQWGAYDCDTTQDAEFWANEVLDSTLRFEFLLLFPILQMPSTTRRTCGAKQEASWTPKDRTPQDRALSNQHQGY